MGKKRRLIANPQKFGRKYAAHPAFTEETTVTTPVVEDKVVEKKVSIPVVTEETAVETEILKSSKKRKSVWSKKKEI